MPSLADFHVFLICGFSTSQVHMKKQVNMRLFQEIILHQTAGYQNNHINLSVVLIIPL